jgi:hypothetical protein
MKDYVDGLYVKDGRLINDRPDGISGIEQAAMIRRSVKRGIKVEEISQGIQKAEAMKMIEKNIRRF